MAHPNTHSALKNNIGSTVVSMTLDKAKSKLGAVVAPAIWIHNYTKHGKKPDIGDYSIYAGTFMSGPAAVVSGLVKSVVEDELESKLKHVKSIEPALYRDWIRPCYGYNNSPPRINAMTIVGTGTTVWHHPIGIWVYVTDANGAPVMDYKPVNPTIVFRPNTPLKKSKSGGYFWSSHKK